MRIKKRKQMRILWITRINAAAISARELQEFKQLSHPVASWQHEQVTSSYRQSARMSEGVPSHCDAFKKHAQIVGGSLVAVPVPANMFKHNVNAWGFTIRTA